MGTEMVLIGSVALMFLVWIVLEIVTLRNDTPDDHITAVVRKAVKAHPGPFVWLAFTLGFLAGHFFWW